MKKMIVFDQDDTINITKMPIDQEMAHLIKALLDKFKVCIISGTNWEIMKKNDIEPLKEIEGVRFDNYYIMPTTGTQFWYHIGNALHSNSDTVIDDGWKRQYAHFLTDEQVAFITQKLEFAAKSLGYWCDDPRGEIIEDRGSQVTYSALGQWASPEDKHHWDVDMKKRSAIVQIIKQDLDNMGLQVSIGGATSIDVTLPGIDKAYGMSKIMVETGLEKDDILFIGDKLQVGGNDYPVKAFGIDTIEVTSCQDTKWVIQGLLAIA